MSQARASNAANANVSAPLLHHLSHYSTYANETMEITTIDEVEKPAGSIPPTINVVK